MVSQFLNAAHDLDVVTFFELELVRCL
jgi:hypothetical protein